MARTAGSAGFSRHRGPEARADVVPLFAVMDHEAGANGHVSVVERAALRAAGAG